MAPWMWNWTDLEAHPATPRAMLRNGLGTSILQTDTDGDGDTENGADRQASDRRGRVSHLENMTSP